MRADAFQMVSVRFVISGARPLELLLPTVLLPFISAIAAALRVPASNVIVTGYLDKSRRTASGLLLRLLQNADTDAATELTFGVRTTPDTLPAAMVASVISGMSADTAANITSAAASALADSTGRTVESFAAAIDVQSVVVAALVASATPASTATGGASTGAITSEQLAGVVIGAVVGTAILVVAVLAFRRFVTTASPRVSPQQPSERGKTDITVVPIALAPVGTLELSNPAHQRPGGATALASFRRDHFAAQRPRQQ